MKLDTYKKVENKTPEMKKAENALLSMQRHSWEQGTAMQAFLEMGDLDTVIAMAFESVNRTMEDGRVATIGVTDGVTDPCAVGEAMLYACEITNDPFLYQGRDKLLEWALEKAPRNEAGTLYHLTRTKEFWADSFYMLPPFLAAAGHYDEAMKQWNGYWKALFDEQAGLLGHMWNEAEQCFTRDAHWGTGNGWMMASIARMMRLLPEEYAEERKSLAERGRIVLDNLLKLWIKEEKFHDVVDDPASFEETNLCQMTAYTIYRGIADGWLDATYKEAADGMRAKAHSKMNAYGFIQDVCGAPTFDKPGYSPEAQAFYLLMETAYLNL